MATLTFRENKTVKSFFQLNFNVYDVVQFYPWFKFSFLLFMGMVMYGDEFETKENKFKPRIKLNHNIYIDVMWLTQKKPTARDKKQRRPILFKANHENLNGAVRK